MKKLIVLITASLLTGNLMAQTYQNDSKMQEQGTSHVKYCAHLMDGKVMIMQDKKDVASDVTLTNGTTIQMDGTVTKKDGTKMYLKNGDCVDNNGKLIDPRDSDKMKSDSDIK